MIDLSPLNGFVRQPPFTMETAASVLLSIREGDFLTFRGPEGCIFPDSHPSVILEVAPVHVGRDGSSVQGALLWIVNRSPGLHESLCRDVRLGSPLRDSSSPVLGWTTG